MQNPTLHRYATRPGLYFTDDGGADAIIRSETADQVWFCVIEPVDQPSAFYSEAIRLFPNTSIPLVKQISEFKVCTRIIESTYVRETLFKMEGPNYGLWSVHIPKAWDGMRYGYRVDGAWDPSHGVRFNPYKLLLDPYGKGIDGTMQLDPAAFAYECKLEDGKIVGDPFGKMNTIDSLGKMPVSVAIDDRATTKFDSESMHPHVPWSKTVIYELHVKGFTANAPWLPEELRGTYAGLAHPTTLAYLQGLGVTSIELLPIQASQPEVFLQERGKRNYWGYSTLSYFSPEASYATKAAQQAGANAVRQEVIDMVQALHDAGFEVLMDVVYNHTCEGGSAGPSICWRGLDNLSYYRRQKNNIAYLEDTTGCGNTLDFTNTHVTTFAADSLRYWAKRIGIDGFRFDLAPSIARLDGEFTRYHPFLYALRSDLLLGNLKIIMEPWDLGNQGWRTGQFGIPFAEWNDRFRDTARTFWLSEAEQAQGNTIGMQEMATRLCGSADLFATDPGRGATASVNFVACHDGFTLHDLTMYSYKHNEANGENNHDGSNMNRSNNFGVEGPSDDPVIMSKRERAAQNLLGMVLLSLGTPMILAGDEFGNTQNGNNNAYCQDNDITWLTWDWLYHSTKTPETHRLESVSKLISIRKSLDLYHHEDFFTRLSQIGLLKPSSRVQWFLPNGTTPKEQDWFDKSIRSFAMRLLSLNELDVILLINGERKDMQFHLPTDTEWQPLWCSAETTGARPAKGTNVEKVDLSNEDSTWTHFVPKDTRIGQVIQTVQSEQDDAEQQPAAKPYARTEDITDTVTLPGLTGKTRVYRLLAHSAVQQRILQAHQRHSKPADSKQTDSSTSPTNANIWTVPSMSITIMRQTDFA